MANTTLEWIRSELARAHRALWTAAQAAETLSDQSLADDLHQVCREVQRLNTSK